MSKDNRKPVKINHHDGADHLEGEGTIEDNIDLKTLKEEDLVRVRITSTKGTPMGSYRDVEAGRDYMIPSGSLS